MQEENNDNVQPARPRGQRRTCPSPCGGCLSYTEEDYLRWKEKEQGPGSFPDTSREGYEEWLYDMESCRWADDHQDLWPAAPRDQAFAHFCRLSELWRKENSDLWPELCAFRAFERWEELSKKWSAEMEALRLCYEDAYAPEDEDEMRREEMRDSCERGQAMKEASQSEGGDDRYHE